MRQLLSQAVQTSAFGVEDGGGLFGEHGAGDVGILDGEGAAEAAALLESVERNEVDAAHGAQEAQGAVAEGEIAEAVAAGVVGDAVRDSRRRRLRGRGGW